MPYVTVYCKQANAPSAAIIVSQQGGQHISSSPPHTNMLLRPPWVLLSLLFMSLLHPPSSHVTAVIPRMVVVVVLMMMPTCNVVAGGVSFHIKPGDEGAHLSKLMISNNRGGSNGASHNLLCEFKFATSTKARTRDSFSWGEDDSSGNGGGSGSTVVSRNLGSIARSSTATILNKLSGVCVRKTVDYWKYEVCLQREIKQSHGKSQEASLGKYSGLEGTVQIYEDGSECESSRLGGRKRSRVEFLCDTLLRVRSVEETTTKCLYRVVIGAPVVCGSPDFDTAPLDDDQAPNEAPRGEWWHVELIELEDHRVACTARTMTTDSRIARAQGSPLTLLSFSKFSLEITGAGLQVDGSSSSSAAGNGGLVTLTHDVHVCRAPDRIRLLREEREYVLTSNGDSKSSVLIKSGDAFMGELEYVFLQVKM